MTTPFDPLSALDAPAILVVAGQPLYREGLVAALSGIADHVQVLAADSAAAGLRAKPGRQPFNLVLLDGNLPDMDGIRAVGIFTRQFPGVPVIVFSASERPEDARRALQGGAAGYVPKTAPTRTLIDAVRIVLGGGTYTPKLLAESEAQTGESGAEGLTPRQLDVLVKLGEGKSNKDIGRDLDMAEKTVKAHIGVVFKRLGVASRTQAMIEGRRRGLIKSD